MESIREICQKFDFTPSRGSHQLEEEWVGPNTLLQTGTLEMESENGAVLIVPVTCRMEFGKYRLDISRQKPQGTA